MSGPARSDPWSRGPGLLARDAGPQRTSLRYYRTCLTSSTLARSLVLLDGYRFLIDGFVDLSVLH